MLFGGFVLGAVVLAVVLAAVLIGLIFTKYITIIFNKGKFISCVTPTYPSCADTNMTDTLCDTIWCRQFVFVSSDLNPSVYFHEASGSNTE